MDEIDEDEYESERERDDLLNEFDFDEGFIDVVKEWFKLFLLIRLNFIEEVWVEFLKSFVIGVLYRLVSIERKRFID